MLCANCNHKIEEYNGRGTKYRHVNHPEGREIFCDPSLDTIASLTPERLDWSWHEARLTR